MKNLSTLVCSLTPSEKEEIKGRLFDKLSEDGMDTEEISALVDEFMLYRLNDISDKININKFLFKVGDEICYDGGDIEFSDGSIFKRNVYKIVRFTKNRLGADIAVLVSVRKNSNKEYFIYCDDMKNISTLDFDRLTNLYSFVFSPTTSWFWYDKEILKQAKLFNQSQQKIS